MKKRLGSIARFVFGIALAAYIIYANRDAFTRLDISAIHWHLFAAGILGCIVMTVMTMVRWYGLVRATGLPFTLRDALVLGFTGYSFNFLLPGAVGGDLVKATMMARRQEKKAVAIVTIAMDRILGMVGLVAFAGIGALLWLKSGGGDERLQVVAQWVLWAIPISIVGIIVMLSKTVCENPLTRWLRKVRFIGPIVDAVLEAFAAYRAKPGAVIIGVLIAMAGHALLMLSLWFLVESMAPGAAPFKLHSLLAPLGLFAGSMPLTPGGLGLLEVAMERVYEYGGLDKGAAVLMIVAYRIAQIIMALAGLVIYKFFADRLTSVSNQSASG